MLKVLLFTFPLSISLPALGNGSTDRPTIIIAVGAAGEEEFGKEFAKWAELWANASDKAGTKQITIGVGGTNNPSSGLAATLSPSDGERDGVRGKHKQVNPPPYVGGYKRTTNHENQTHNPLPYRGRFICIC